MTHTHAHNSTQTKRKRCFIFARSRHSTIFQYSRVCGCGLMSEATWGFSFTVLTIMTCSCCTCNMCCVLGARVLECVRMCVCVSNALMLFMFSVHIPAAWNKNAACSTQLWLWCTIWMMRCQVECPCTSGVLVMSHKPRNWAQSTIQLNLCIHQIRQRKHSKWARGWAGRHTNENEKKFVDDKLISEHSLMSCFVVYFYFYISYFICFRRRRPNAQSSLEPYGCGW